MFWPPPNSLSSFAPLFSQCFLLRSAFPWSCNFKRVCAFFPRPFHIRSFGGIQLFFARFSSGRCFLKARGIVIRSFARYYVIIQCQWHGTLLRAARLCCIVGKGRSGSVLHRGGVCRSWTEAARAGAFGGIYRLFLACFRYILCDMGLNLGERIWSWEWDAIWLSH